MDLNFEQMLAQHNQEYKDAEVFSNWMPPDGEYIVSLIKLDNGTSSKDGVDTIWWKLIGRIEDVQDEKLNGKEFSVGYYSSKAFGVLKGAVKALNGDIIHDLGDAHVVLEASIGTIIRAKVETSTSRKNGKEYTNCYIQEVLDATASAGVDQAPAVETDDNVAGDTVGAGLVEAPPVV